MDFSAICRTCLGTDSLNPIFAKTVDHKRYSTAIFIAAGIKVKLDDGMPQQMCTICINYLNNNLKFRKQCKDSEKQLTQLKPQLNRQNHIELKHHYNIKATDKLEVTNDVKIIVKVEEQSELSNLENVKCGDDSDLENKPLSCFNQKDNQNYENYNELSKTDKLKVKSGVGKKKVERVSCPICHKDLSARSLRAHVVARHGAGAMEGEEGDAGGGGGAGVETLRCGNCKVEYDSKEALGAHAAACPLKKKRRASGSGRELVSCDVCQKRMQRASLRAHVAVKHKGLGPVCEHCGRRFGNKLRLTEHLRAKHGLAKLRCQHCDFASASSAALQNHERRHRGEKPFVCEACGAKFHAAYLLAQHRHSHRTDRRVKCGLCGAAFKTANGLHAHRLAAHAQPARAARCPLCARRYRCRHYAVKHMRAVHGYKGVVPPLQVDPDPS